MSQIEIPEPYYMFGDTCWRGPLGDIRLSNDNEVNIDDNGSYGTPEDCMVMVMCLLAAYTMALTVPPSNRPK